MLVVQFLSLCVHQYGHGNGANARGWCAVAIGFLRRYSDANVDDRLRFNPVGCRSRTPTTAQVIPAAVSFGLSSHLHPEVLGVAGPRRPNAFRTLRGRSVSATSA